MIRRAYRATVRLLTSAGLVSGLLAFIGVWSMVASFVPQGDASTREVASWAAANGAIEPVVRVVGLHQAFTGFVFLACVSVLALSTALCSWRRTRVSIHRARTLLKALGTDGRSIAEKHDLEIPCDPALSESEVLSIASETLAGIGIRTKPRDGLLTAVSSPLSVWGSPVFHWALLALMAVILVGNLQRSDGLMALSVGQTKVDAPGSYGVLRTGPARDWSRVHRSFRLDSFEPDYRLGGIDRGPVPTVSVLDGEGNVLKTQRVYPNMMLHSGSVSISAPACGLSATLSLVDTSGVEIGRSVRPIDFSQTAVDGTVPVESLSLFDHDGNPRLRVSVTVPLSGTPGRFDERLPKDPTARMVVSSPEGVQLLDRIVKPGEEVVLPTGSRLRLVGIGWYSRLSIADDWTTPLIYAAMMMAVIGLTVTLLARQQLLVASVVMAPDGAKLVLQLRLWRNVPTSSSEITSELTKALGSDAKGGTS